MKNAAAKAAPEKSKRDGAYIDNLKPILCSTANIDQFDNTEFSHKPVKHSNNALPLMA
jgi:hypothetical protein